MKLLRDKGAAEFIRPRVAINRFPEFVSRVVADLKRLCPHLGKQAIADHLARAALHLSTSTVGKMLKRSAPSADEPDGTDGAGGDAPSTPDAPHQQAPKRVVTAKHPGHVWNADVTVVPIAQGLTRSDSPFAWPQLWPFCWHLAAIVDHFSRKVVGFQVLRKAPTARQVVDLLELTIACEGRPPSHIVSDQGVQFRDQWRDACEAHGIQPRFGAVGQSGSIALIERFWGTLKREWMRRTLVAYDLNRVREDLRVYLAWYNECRPHSALGGATPHEVHAGLQPACEAPRFEPRRGVAAAAKLPARAPKRVAGRRGQRVELVVESFEGRQHLPVVTLRHAA
jgi:putative transposase